MQTAPDGLCAICRRERAVAAASYDRPVIPSWVFGVLALLVLGGTIEWWVTRPPKEVVVERHGPTIEEEIANVDKQIEEMRRARQRGELDGAGLNHLSRLESRRAVLDVRLRAKQDN